MARARGLPVAWRRGAEARATRERASFGLTPGARLDPRAFAAHHGVRVVDLSALPGVAAEHVEYLRRPDSKDLSALTVLRGGRSIIVANDAHLLPRQANSITHEMAHLLLGHPTTQLFDGARQRIYPERYEDEANWLAGCLLVPVAGLAATLRRTGDRERAAEHYGVSVELLRWRCNMHGFARVAA